MKQAFKLPLLLLIISALTSSEITFPSFKTREERIRKHEDFLENIGSHKCLHKNPDIFGKDNAQYSFNGCDSIKKEFAHPEHTGWRHWSNDDHLKHLKESKKHVLQVLENQPSLINLYLTPEQQEYYQQSLQEKQIRRAQKYAQEKYVQEIENACIAGI